jgi:hypothetical protein
MPDDPPLQPLVVPPTAIPDPLQPAAVPAGQIPSLVPGGGRAYQPIDDLGRRIATSVAGSSIADQMVKDFVKQQNLPPTYRHDFIAPYVQEYRKHTAMTPVPQSFRGESFDTAFRGQAGELRPGVAGGIDMVNQFRRGALHAMDESFIGTVVNRLMNYGALYKAAQETTDPDYDQFNDPQIREAGLDNQMHMFFTSGSREQSRLIIDYYKKRQQETQWLDRASGIVGWTAGAGEIAGSLIGDPVNLLPGSLGIKGLSLSMRGAKGLLTGPEFGLIAGRRAVYGSIADGLRVSAINAAAMIAEQALMSSIDPTLPGDVTADIILPSVIAGSLGLYAGLAARRVARKLSEEVRQQDFLKPANAPRYGAPDQPGGIRREPVAGEHSGDFPAGSLATDYGDMVKTEARADPYKALASPKEETAAGTWRAVGPDEVFPPGQHFRMDQTTGVSEVFVPKPVERRGFVNKAGEPSSQAAGKAPPLQADLPTGPGPDVAGLPESMWASKRKMDARNKAEADAIAHGQRTGERIVMPHDEGAELDATGRPITKGGGGDTRSNAILHHTGPRASDFRLGQELMEGNGYLWRVGGTEHSKVWDFVSDNRPKGYGKSVGGGPGFLDVPDKAPKGKRLIDQEFDVGELETVQLTARQVQDLNLGDNASRGPHAFVRGGPEVKDGDATMPNGAGVVRAADFGTGQRLFDDANREWVVLPTGKDGAKEFHLTGETFKVDGLSSVGAAQNPASQINQRQVLLDQGRMAPSGLGIENWGLTPVSRIFRGESIAAMDTTTKLVSTSGLQTKGNQLGLSQVGQPVEVLIQVNWNRPMVQVQRATQDAWIDYRRALANVSQPAPPSVAGRSDTARVAAQVGTAISDVVHTGEKGLSFAQFKERVGLALDRADVDNFGDKASSYVARAAAEHRRLYNVVREKAIELGLFDEAYKEAIDLAQAGVKAIKKEADEIKRKAAFERWDPARIRQAEEALMVRMEDAQYKFRRTQNQLDELKAHGPQLNGSAPSFRPTVYRVDKLMDGEEKFVTVISDWLQSQHALNGGQLAQEDAVRIAKQIHTLLSKQNPIYERGDQKALFHGVANPSSVQARSLNIPHELIQEFLEQDAEVLMRYHIKQMGTAIEMKTKFGSLDLADEIAEIEQEYRQQIIAANKGATEPTERAKELTAMMKGAIADVQAMRDRLYGTYGASPDPQRWQSRTIRMAKQFNNLTLMGMSGITALGDLVRPLVTEGADAFFGYGLRTLMHEQRALILRLNREELEHTGLGMELQLNTRALSFADNGDIFAGRTAFERGMNQANSWMFVANGLNHVNQMDKELASLVIGGRVNKVFLGLTETRTVMDASRLNPRFATLADDELKAAIAKAEQDLAALTGSRQIGTRLDRAQALRLEIAEHEAEVAARGDQQFTGKLSAKDLARFAAVGIDEAMARRIGLQLKIHKHEFTSGGKTLIIANSEAWSDKAAQQAYRGGMNQMTNRTVPTPGIADTPLVMSTELGGLLTQYKNFAFGAMNRVLLSGLQEDGMKFWYGAGMMVASAAILNEIRSQLFYGKSTTDKPFPAIIADAVDRSSILGWFGDVDRAVTMLSGNSVGIKPMMGAASPVQPRFSQVAGAVGGPAAGQAARILSVANAALSGHPTAQTYRDWRNVVPLQNHPFMDPVMDMLLEKDGLMPSVFGVNKEPRRRPAGL